MTKKSEHSPDVPPELSSAVVSALGNNQKYHFILILTGILVGASFCLAGLVLALLGASGTIDWIISGPKLTSRLTNATPGVLFAILGAAIVWRFRPQMQDLASFDSGAVHLTRNYQVGRGHHIVGSETLHHERGLTDNQRRPKSQKPQH